MKKNPLLSSCLSLLLIANISFAQSKDPINDYMQKSTASSVVLNAPGNFSGDGLQVTGQSSSPYDLLFMWTDNSTNEDGFKFQRYKLGIYWDFGCVAPANATVKNHTLSFWPLAVEKFRAFAYSGSNRSSYAYSSVEMLRPDLTVSNIVLSSTQVNSGGQVNVSYTVNNIGTYQALSSTLKYYISKTPNGTDIEIGSYLVGEIPIGASISNSATLTIPSTYAFGNSYIVCKANATGSILELLTTNNISSSSIMILNADLTVSNLTVSKNQINVGEQINVSCLVENIGTSNMETSILKYYIASTTTGTDKELGSYSIGELAIGASISNSATLTIPSTYSGGNYYIVCRANATDIPESSLSNNYASKQIVVVNPNEKPDLIVLSTSLNGTQSPINMNGILYPAFRSGDYGIWISLTIKNQGTATSPSACVKNYFSKDEILDNYDTNLNSVVFTSAIPANSETGNYQAAFDIPTGLPTGWYYILTRVDSDLLIAESNENNNILSTQIYVWGGSKTIEKPLIELSKTTNLPNNSEIIIYPNPSIGQFTMNFDKDSYTDVKIYSSIGQLVYSEKVNNKTKMDFNLVHLSNGIYTIQLIGGDGSVTKKVIIQK